MPEQVATKLTLPTEPTRPSTEIHEFRWLIHGWPKVGKTSLASQFKKAIFLRSEEGTKALSVYKIDIGSWKDASDSVNLLLNEKHDFLTIVFDVFERYFYFLYSQICLENSVRHISDIKFGRGYDEANLRMWNMLEALSKKGLGVVLICHSRLIESSQGAMQVMRIVPDLSDSPRKVITGWPDITLYMATDPSRTNEGKPISDSGAIPRVAYCQPFPDIEAGGRIRHLPARLELGTDPVYAYRTLEDEFRKAIARQLEELGIKPSEPVSSPA